MKIEFSKELYGKLLSDARAQNKSIPAIITSILIKHFNNTTQNSHTKVITDDKKETRNRVFNDPSGHTNNK